MKQKLAACFVGKSQYSSENVWNIVRKVKLEREFLLLYVMCAVKSHLTKTSGKFNVICFDFDGKES